MSVVIETTLGDITVDLFVSERPTACMNFLKLCKLKYYNFNLFHTISRGFIAQTGDPTGSRTGGESVFGVLNGSNRRYFQGENKPRIKHTKMGLISFVGNEDFMLGSQFFLTLGEDLTYLDEKHCVFGEVTEGFDILEIINEVICDGDDRPYQDVRITHTVILDDPFPDPEGLKVPSRSPSPSAERLMGGRIAPDEEIDEMEGKNAAEVAELQADQEAKARATILEMVGDIPDAEMAPPENVLFVCKLNPVTTDEDLEIIFNRFGKIKSCEVIRDRKTGDSLQYAFIEFEDQKACEDAYFKMDNILIDDRRIHVDFSQSVSKIKWNGKGRGVTHYDEKGKKILNNSEMEKTKIDKESRERDKNSFKYGKNENKPYRTYKRDDSSNIVKNKLEGNKRDSEKYSRRSPIRVTKKYSNSQKRREYKDMYKSEERNSKEYYSRKKQEYNSKNYKKYCDEEKSRRRRDSTSDYDERDDRKSDSHKKSHRKKYSSESSDDYDNKLSKKTISKVKSTEMNKSNKETYKSKHSKSSKKKIINKSSSDSSDNELYKKKKKNHKHSRETDSTSDSSSEDNIKYKKKLKKKQNRTSSSESSENIQRRQKSKKDDRKIKKRKSSDSESETDRKRKRRK